MRTVTVILILLNAALATMGRPQPRQNEHGVHCCRSSGVDAYCCRYCCAEWNCDFDSDCR